LGLPLRRAGSGPFTGADLRALRCVHPALAGSLAVHHRARALRSDRGLRGPRHSGGRLGSFLLKSTTPVVFLPPLLCDCLLSSTVRRSPLAGFCSPRLRCLSWGCPKIASPSVHLAGVHSQPRATRHSRGLRFDAFEAGVATALSRDPPSFRPRRFHDLAGFRLHQAAGVCTRPRSWGSSRFPRPRLSPPPRSPQRGSALRSLPPRSARPPPLTRWLRRSVTRASLPTPGSPNPFPPRSCPVRLRDPDGTSRACSCCGAVPPCAVSSADGPLLPWACQSCD